MTHEKQVVTVGESIGVFRALNAGSTPPGALFELGWGGAEIDVAVGLSRLGVPTTWLSALGDDILGEAIRGELLAEGVTVAASTEGNRATGLMVRSDGLGDDIDARYLYSWPPTTAITFDECVESVLHTARWIHLSGLFPALSESTLETTHEIVDFAVSNGIPYSLDINFRPELWTQREARGCLLALASDAAIVFGEHSELEILVGAHSAWEELCESVSRLGAREVVVTSGSIGSGVFFEGSFSVTPLPTASPQENVFKGSAFISGYLSQRLGGETPARSLARGTICSLVASQAVGASEASPDLAEVVRLESAVFA